MTGLLSGLIILSIQYVFYIFPLYHSWVISQSACSSLCPFKLHILQGVFLWVKEKYISSSMPLFHLVSEVHFWEEVVFLEKLDSYLLAAELNPLAGSVAR